MRPGRKVQFQAARKIDDPRPSRLARGADPRIRLLDAFDAKSAEARAALSGATDEDLAKIWTLSFKGQQIFSLPRAAVLRSMCMNHLYHHRGQLGVYLRMNNVAIPGMYGPSADEMSMFNAQSA
jgi:uncharacterized damage-inducible protein DinB